MMTRKDYRMLAERMGDGFAIAALHGGGDGQREFHDAVYLPLTDALHADNSRFDRLTFAEACGVAESRYLAAARERGREVVQ